MAHPPPLRILRLIDGKPGHQSQTLGLVAALQRLTPTEVREHDIHKASPSWPATLLRRPWLPPACDPQNPPDLAIAAGSATHPALIALARHPDIRTALLMAPPVGFTRTFDLCIVPEHDDRNGCNIISTTGALNPIVPNPNADSHRGLLLIGGPSKHHAWDAPAIINALQNILAANPTIPWTATNSRRTPPETARALHQLATKQPTLDFHPVESTPPGWVAQQLAQNGLVWATEDSVSMVYEALSSGARVGLLPVPRKNSRSRIVAGLDRCLARNWLTPFTTPAPDLSQLPPGPALREADRVAQIILERLFPDHLLK